jgi:hypothetical protein
MASDMSMKERALTVFRRPPERLNCAQAVLLAYREVSGDTSLRLGDMKSCGAGRAPGGVCGALHAACVLAPDKAEALLAKFAERMGAVRCKELRRKGNQACEHSVATAAELLEVETKL